MPCGIEDRGVTSMELETGHPVDIVEFKRKIAEELAGIWGFRLKWVGKEVLEEMVGVTA